MYFRVIEDESRLGLVQVFTWGRSLVYHVTHLGSKSFLARTADSKTETSLQSDILYPTSQGTHGLSCFLRPSSNSKTGVERYGSRRHISDIWQHLH